MEKWVVYALLSMVFAGFTSVIAKMGLSGISGELGLSVRTVFVAVFILGFALLTVPVSDYSALNRQNILWLGLSGVTTSLSWIFYYKALKLGDVATVALIDKGSVVVAIILAWLLLQEAITPRIIAGSVLIIGGLLVIVKKP